MELSKQQCRLLLNILSRCFGLTKKQLFDDKSDLCLPKIINSRFWRTHIIYQIQANYSTIITSGWGEPCSDLLGLWYLDQPHMVQEAI